MPSGIEFPITSDADTVRAFPKFFQTFQRWIVISASFRTIPTLSCISLLQIALILIRIFAVASLKWRAMLRARRRQSSSLSILPC